MAVEPSWNHRGTIVEPSWNHRGTIVEPSWNHRGTIVGGCHSPAQCVVGRDGDDHAASLVASIHVPVCLDDSIERKGPVADGAGASAAGDFDLAPP